MTELIKDKLVQGKWYKFYKKELRDHWNFVNLETYSQFELKPTNIVKYTYSTPILFLEKIDKHMCLKFFYQGRIIYCNHAVMFEYEEIKC